MAVKQLINGYFKIEQGILKLRDLIVKSKAKLAEWTNAINVYTDQYRYDYIVKCGTFNLYRCSRTDYPYRNSKPNFIQAKSFLN